MNREKWPREYAAEIMALGSVEKRRAALAKVPEHLRDWVQGLVRDGFARQKADRRVS